MKRTGFALYAATAILALFALLLISGCGGGSKTNGINSPWNGSLDGVETSPFDEETDVPRDAWIHVYWPHDGYPPPRQFTVSLQKEETPGNWGAVSTRLSSTDSDPVNGSWWLEPVSQFSPFTWYRIIIRETGEIPVYVEFLTGDWFENLSVSAPAKGLTAKAAKSYRPAGAVTGTGEASLEHTITTPAR